MKLGEQHVEAPVRSAVAVRRAPTRVERMRQAIRSALAGVALTLVVGTGVALAESNSTYTVTPGDNLRVIAAQAGVSVDDLISANGLGDPDAIQIGQVLRLPNGASLDRPAPASRGNRVASDGDVTRSFQWPLQGPITTPYGEPGPLWRVGYHPGLDIGASVGTPIRAIADGVVVEADDSDAFNKGYGHYVKIDHGGGLISLYGHMSTVRAREGERVTMGTLIGNVGMTGVTTGPHVHLEIRQDGNTRDPIRYIGS
jgi:murein DD-endopeptidase MepM/ murein hydrolase activator NlpD